MIDREFRSLGEYCRASRREMAAQMAGLTRFYLDTKFWVFVRDAYLGRAQNDIHRLLYERLLQLVRSAKLVCPATDSVLYEVFHQEDFSTRLATAKVIDELSGGIALEEKEQRVRIEILYFLRSGDDLERASDWVWTRTCWALGEMHPHLPNLSPEVEGQLQIGFMEEMRKRGVADMVAALKSASGPLPKSFFDRLAGRLNDGKVRHLHQMRSRQQVFMAEVEGVLDVYRPEIAAAMAYVRGLNVLDTDVDREVEKMKELFRSRKIGTLLPFFNTQAGLHALFRWNRDQSSSRMTGWIIVTQVARCPTLMCF